MRTVGISIFAIIALSGNAHAANLAVITSPPTIMNLVVMLLGVAGVVIGIQLLSSLRGGMMVKAWQIFVAGFGVLVLGQLSILLQTFEIASLPGWVSPGLMVLWAGTFFYGAFEAKRILS
jgi:hypothetical protein